MIKRSAERCRKFGKHLHFTRCTNFRNLLDIEFLNLNLKEHLKYLNRFINKFLDVEHAINTLDREEMYLLQFSIYSVVEWYMTTYFKSPFFNLKKSSL